MASNCVVCFVCVALVIFTKTHSAYESVESNGSTISLDTNISLVSVIQKFLQSTYSMLDSTKMS